MNLPKSARSDALLFLGGWILLICLINPIGNYPINDDWAYAQIVKRLLESGVYDLGFWPGMTLFTHVMWGSLFCKIFGFSFTILRLSTLVMAMVGSWVFFQLVRELLGEDIWSRRIALGTLVFNPFFLLLSFSYMTDVPFLTLVLLALLFFKKAFEQDRYLHWALALACCVAAILTRQLALLLPLTFGGVMVLKYRDIKHLLLAVAIVLFSFLSLYGYTSYMEATVGLPPPFGRPESLLSRLNFKFITGQIKHRGGDPFILLELLSDSFSGHTQIPFPTVETRSWYFDPGGAPLYLLLFFQLAYDPDRKSFLRYRFWSHHPDGRGKRVFTGQSPAAGRLEGDHRPGSISLGCFFVPCGAKNVIGSQKLEKPGRHQVLETGHFAPFAGLFDIYADRYP